MFEELNLSQKFYYHNFISIIMLLFWIFIGFKGYRLKNHQKILFTSNWIIIICLIQESLDFINRLYLDQNYTFSIHRDLPFLQFCQISFYFSLICIFLSKNIRFKKNKYTQFLFDCAFLLGFSGALQGIITPDFEYINNMIGVICIQLQHSLIILNIIWLIIMYNYKLTFKGVIYTYLFINIIAPFALLLNKLLGTNSDGLSANYFYVNELPKADNYFLNIIAHHPSPDYILYIQPIFILYFIALYFLFLAINILKIEKRAG
tara:strand:- start:3488 stop:4273 length:786 start_codon:yes stop_codon:yes gene_type:complete